MVLDGPLPDLHRPELEVVEPRHAHAFEVGTVPASKPVVVHELLLHEGQSLSLAHALAVHEVIVKHSLGEEIAILGGTGQGLEQSRVTGHEGIASSITHPIIRDFVGDFVNKSRIPTLGKGKVFLRDAAFGDRTEFAVRKERPDRQLLVAVLDRLNAGRELADRHAVVGTLSHEQFHLKLTLTFPVLDVGVQLVGLPLEPGEDVPDRHAIHGKLVDVRHEVGSRNDHRLHHDQHLGISHDLLENLFSINQITVCLITSQTDDKILDLLLNHRGPTAIACPEVAHRGRPGTGHVEEHIPANPEAILTKLGLYIFLGFTGDYRPRISDNRVRAFRHIHELVGPVLLTTKGPHVVDLIHQFLVDHPGRLFFRLAALPRRERLGEVEVLIQIGQFGRIGGTLIGDDPVRAIIDRQ